MKNVRFTGILVACCASAWAGGSAAQSGPVSPPPILRPAPPPPPPPSRETGVRGSIAGLISEEDYPLEARNANQEGRVGVRLYVGVHGRVSRCTIYQSSGFSSLDVQTCRLLRERARFAPARDARGRAVEGSIQTRVLWKLQNPTMPSQAWAMRGLVTVVGPGSTPGCSVEGEGAIAGKDDLLWDCKDLLQGFPVDRIAPVPEGTTAIFISEERFVPAQLDEAAIAALPAGDILVGREILRLEIDETGSISKCEMTSASGLFPSGRPCTDYDEHFVPMIGKNGKPVPFEATVILTASVRNETRS